jgi:hypothetical protein
MTSIAVLMVGVLLTAEGFTWAADKAVMRPRVPRDQIEAARAVTNPLPASEEMIAKGKALYEGKAFCKVCHGPDGKGLGKDIAPGSLKGPLPRNFTDKKWQSARTDGELFWILKNGSKGSDGSFIHHTDGRRSCSAAIGGPSVNHKRHSWPDVPSRILSSSHFASVTCLYRCKTPHSIGTAKRNQHLHWRTCC